MLTKIACLFPVIVWFLSAAQPGGAQAQKGPADLQGVWKLVSVESNGTATDFTDRQPRWVIKDKKVLYAGEELAALTVDPATTPKVIDLSFRSSKKVYEGIYAVEEDTLKVCVNTQTDGVKERPQTFTTKDKEHWRLLVFKRDKAGAENETEGLSGFVGLVLGIDKEREEVNVNDTIDDSPAKKAGLRKDDVVLKVAGGAVTDLRSAVDAVRQAKPGSMLTFRIRRDGKESDVTVKVGVLPFSVLAQLD
jgi:uncharacterized protein (TIGR03067 family)